MADGFGGAMVPTGMSQSTGFGLNISQNQAQNQASNSAYNQSHAESFIPNYSEEPILERIAQEAENYAPQVYRWGMDAYNRSQGLIDNLYRQGQEWASPQHIATQMGQAEAGVQQAGAQALESSKRDLESYGIDPSAGRYAGLEQASRVATAAAAAGAGNQQRNADIAQGLTMQNQAISAGLQNTQTGYGAANALNALYATGMSLKYPPLGQTSTSSGTSAGASSGFSTGTSFGTNQQQSTSERMQPTNVMGFRGVQVRRGGYIGHDGVESPGYQRGGAITARMPSMGSFNPSTPMPSLPAAMRAGRVSSSLYGVPYGSMIRQAEAGLANLPAGIRARAEGALQGAEGAEPAMLSRWGIPEYQMGGQVQKRGKSQKKMTSKRGKMPKPQRQKPSPREEEPAAEPPSAPEPPDLKYGVPPAPEMPTSAPTDVDMGDGDQRYARGGMVLDDPIKKEIERKAGVPDTSDDDDQASGYARGGFIDPVREEIARRARGGGTDPVSDVGAASEAGMYGGAPSYYRQRQRPFLTAPTPGGPNVGGDLAMQGDIMQRGMETQGLRPEQIAESEGYAGGGVVGTTALGFVPATPTPAGVPPGPPTQAFAQGGAVPNETTGGFVSHAMSPSDGRQVDDVPARLNEGEYVIPRDIVHWKGKDFFHRLIAQSRKTRAMHGAPSDDRGYNFGGPVQGYQDGGGVDDGTDGGIDPATGRRRRRGVDPLTGMSAATEAGMYGGASKYYGQKSRPFLTAPTPGGPNVGGDLAMQGDIMGASMENIGMPRDPGYNLGGSI